MPDVLPAAPEGPRPVPSLRESLCRHNVACGVIRAVPSPFHDAQALTIPCLVQAIKVPDVLPAAPEGPRPVPSFAGVSVLPVKRSLYCSTMSQMSALSASCGPVSAGHPQVQVSCAITFSLRLNQHIDRDVTACTEEYQSMLKDCELTSRRRPTTRLRAPPCPACPLTSCGKSELNIDVCVLCRYGLSWLLPAHRQ